MTEQQLQDFLDRGRRAQAAACPRCGLTSHHPNDVAEGYCGHCHDWTSR